MKRALTMLAAVLALPLPAEEPAGKPPAAAQQQPAVTSTADSPLVAAAKRSKRLGKKPTKVITNETLAKTSGRMRVITTDNQTPINVPMAPPQPTAEMQARAAADEQRRKAEAEAAKKQKAGAERQRKRDAAAAAAEDDLYTEDDADASAAERKAAEAQKPPQF